MTDAERMQMLQDKALSLFRERNAAYGSSFKTYGVLGVVCQVLSAVARLPQMVLWAPEHGKGTPEKLRDVMLDIANYALMTILCIEDGNWDGRPQ